MEKKKETFNGLVAETGVGVVETHARTHTRTQLLGARSNTRARKCSYIISFPTKLMRGELKFWGKKRKNVNRKNLAHS